MDVIKLTDHDIKLDMRVPWPIYGADGRMLLHEGQTISSKKILDVLLSCGACRAPTPEEIPNIVQDSPKRPLYQRLEGIKIRNHEMLQGINRDDGSNFSGEITALLDELGQLCRENADLVLGAILLDRKSPYSMLLPVMTAVVSDLTGKRAGLSDEERKAAMAAALLSDVSILDLQTAIAERMKPLTTRQLKQMHDHPINSCELIKKAGIDEPIWMDIVLKHHEKIDGSGYPMGLNAMSFDEIPVMARIVSLADTYSSMLLNWHYRDGDSPNLGIQYMFNYRGEKHCNVLVNQFIKEMGLYPPGILVKLKNHERGIVIRRGVKKANRPVVSCLYNEFGAALEHPKIRDTMKLDAYAIAKVLPIEKELPFGVPTIWGYANST